MMKLALAGAVAFFGTTAFAQTPAPGECATGFCGTPNNNGGGCGCGCGCSILVAYTDIGQTYSSSDLDPDHDGVPTADPNTGRLIDNCPFIFNPDQKDVDGDVVGDVCDNCPAVANPDQFTLGAHKDVNGFAIGFACDADGDGDGIATAVDNCPMVANHDQAVAVAGSKLGDACNPDIDADGVLNIVGAKPYDNCPFYANPSQALPSDTTLLAKCNVDTDKDTVLDSTDNCVGVPNPDQKKTVSADLYKGDPSYKFLGDACNPDIDGDVVLNQLDNCPLVFNADQKDSDNDGVGDACQTTAFCMHPVRSDAHCLDPQGVFDVYAFPTAVVNTGNRVFLDLFANRDNVGIRYTFTVDAKPAESNVAVHNAQGSVSQSQAMQYHYADDSKRPIFTPDVAGEYKIRVSADLVNPDTLFSGSDHAEAVLTLTAQGPSMQQGGCTVVPGAETRGSLWLVGLGLLLALGLTLRSLRTRTR